MPKTVAESDLTAEFIRLGIKPNNSEFMTVRELADSWGIGEAAARKRLHMAMEAGILERGRKQIDSLSGAKHTVTAYRINLPKGKR